MNLKQTDDTGLCSEATIVRRYRLSGKQETTSVCNIEMGFALIELIQEVFAVA